jgi:hypothetical protein
MSIAAADGNRFRHPILRGAQIDTFARSESYLAGENELRRCGARFDLNADDVLASFKFWSDVNEHRHPKRFVSCPLILAWEIQANGRDSIGDALPFLARAILKRPRRPPHMLPRDGVPIHDDFVAIAGRNHDPGIHDRRRDLDSFAKVATVTCGPCRLDPIARKGDRLQRICCRRSPAVATVAEQQGKQSCRYHHTTNRPRQVSPALGHVGRYWLGQSWHVSGVWLDG